MNKYEAMFIVKADLSEDDKKNLFNQIGEAVTKNNGQITNTAVWAERKKLLFPIKKQHEGIYYLMNFTLNPLAIKEIKHAYNLNEFILRTLFTRLED